MSNPQTSHDAEHCRFTVLDFHECELVDGLCSSERRARISDIERHHLRRCGEISYYPTAVGNFDGDAA